jgi:hypothetical protein
MAAQTIIISFNGKDEDLHVEQETYNGKPAYYLQDGDLSKRFEGHIPDHLVIFETVDGVQCSPRVITLEGRHILESIWNGIRKQGSNTPQPYGPGLG